MYVLNLKEEDLPRPAKVSIVLIGCKVTIPILWELVLDQETHNYDKLRKKALCIRIYISCMDTQARTILTQNRFDLSSSPPQATFDYPSFTHKFRIDNLVYYIFYSQKSIGSDKDITKSRILFREICKLIINRCTFLDSFNMTDAREDFCKKFLNSDLIGSIIKLPNAPKELKSDSQMKLLGKLISVQKRLKNLSIIGVRYINCNSLLSVIISQNETLKSLRLKSVYFEEKSLPIEQFTSLQEFYVEDCYRLDCLSFASLFTQLISFHLTNFYNNNLNYCTNITELTLPDLSLKQVIEIFKNNFNELRRFSFSYGAETGADKLLCQLAESVPESLETIEIRMGIFSADSLRYFFEGWCRVENKKMMIVNRQVLSDEHWKVIEEYGVQFEMKYMKQ
ncbi:2298_t:CDS:2 [Diversispora eburnea]|uniref:2298_t:CDS:1 n=1 Tax=Diversispora eburnea TaxID=1213867 RepID=A0A9N9AZX2_9GLOM|nr:2298_t:CDS:2 [Diversispora eburnea]